MVHRRRLKLHSPRPTVPLLRVAAGRLSLREMTMTEIIPWLIQPASEPSTWAGFASLAVVFGLSQDEWAAVSNAVATVAAALAMFVREQKPD